MALFDFLKRKKGGGKDGHDMRYREKAKEDARRQEKHAGNDIVKNVGEGASTASKIYVSDRASRILIHPSVTEKSARLAERGVYTFRTKEGATKNEIKKAVEELYRVRVEKVNVTDTKLKPRMMRGRAGIKQGFQKAIVSLRKGEKIEFV